MSKNQSLLIVLGLVLFCSYKITGKARFDQEEPITHSATNTSQNLRPQTLGIYLLLNGNCKEAMEFYKSVFGGELTFTKVGDSPMKNYFPETMHKKIVNARLTAPNVDISASDWLRPNQTPVQGNMVCLYLTGGTSEELKTVFTKLSEGASVTDPLAEQPFGLYGALNDKFGIRWMFHADKN